LKRNGTPISMDDLIKNIDSGKDFNDKSFAITFDDGFYNNYSIAMPILKKMKIPATFYVTSDFIDKNLTSWIDRIEIAVNSLSYGKIEISKKKLEFNKSQKSKIKFLDNLRKIIKNNRKIDPYKITNKILKDLNYKKEILHSNNILDKKMSWSQVKRMDSQKLFTIGGHSKTHRILSFLSSEDVKKEINQSLRILEKNLKRKIVHYSYPEGLKHTFSKREISLLKAKGVKCCPSAESGINYKNADLFKLKRIFCV